MFVRKPLVLPLGKWLRVKLPICLDFLNCKMQCNYNIRIASKQIFFFRYVLSQAKNDHEWKEALPRINLN